MASSARRPVESTPWPRRVTVVRRSRSSTVPFVTSATSMRVVFVPRSTTATRIAVTLSGHPSEERSPMTKVVHCECGFNAEGETDDEIVQAVQDHVKDAHPDAGEFTREQ